MDKGIVDWAPWGEHIPLKCGKCGAKGYHTKNIGFIGARSIFLSGTDNEGCGCPGSYLRPDKDSYLARKAVVRVPLLG